MMDANNFLICTPVRLFGYNNINGMWHQGHWKNNGPPISSLPYYINIKKCDWCLSHIKISTFMEKCELTRSSFNKLNNTSEAILTFTWGQNNCALQRLDLSSSSTFLRKYAFVQRSANCVTLLVISYSWERTVKCNKEMAVTQEIEKSHSRIEKNVHWQFNFLSRYIWWPAHKGHQLCGAVRKKCNVLSNIKMGWHTYWVRVNLTALNWTKGDSTPASYSGCPRLKSQPGDQSTILTDVVHEFPHSSQANSGLVHLLRPWLLPYTSFPIYYSL
jgi:hypothetical protein